MFFQRSKLAQAIIVFAILVAIDLSISHEVSAFVGGWPSCPSATCNGQRPEGLGFCLDPFTSCQTYTEAACPLSSGSCSSTTGDYPMSVLKTCSGPNFCANNHCTAATTLTTCYYSYACEWNSTQSRCNSIELCSTSQTMNYKKNTWCGF